MSLLVYFPLIMFEPSYLSFLQFGRFLLLGSVQPVRLYFIHWKSCFLSSEIIITHYH